MQQQIFPVSLYRSNLALQLRMMQLMQECGQRWLESTKKRNEEALASTLSELDDLPETADLQSLLAKRIEAYGRAMQIYMGSSQSLTDTVIQDQAAWLAGMQQALQNWQAEINDHLSRNYPEPWQPGKALTKDESKPATQNNKQGA